MRNFEIPQMKISIFTEEVLTTDSTVDVQPEQLAAIEAFNSNNPDALIGRASFTELMKKN